jgi:MoaA/NifB/PqqE/SkfB family radical SAM enzyme
MNFVGGEPLMFKGLTNLMQLAVELGFTVSFNTNGWLVNQSNARAFCEAGVSIAYVSLDGASEHTVDVTRGKAGSFDKAIQAIEHFERLPNPRVVVATVLHAKNALEIPALLQFVKERGLQVVVQPLYQNFGENTYEPDWFKRSELWPQDQSELTPIFEALDLLSTERFRGGPVCNTVSQLQAMKTHFAQPQSSNGVSCRAGHSDLSFDARGNIRLCYFLDPVGSIFDSTPLPVLWDHPRALRRRHQVSRCERHCNLLNCNFEANGKQPIRHAKEPR